jgi:catechol 2,3-dioxygenase
MCHSLGSQPIDPGTRIGHVHLKVANLDRSLHYYCDVLGFAVTQRFDRQTALISAGGYHHLIGLNTRESEGGLPPPKVRQGSITSLSSIRTGRHSPTRWDG